MMNSDAMQSSYAIQRLEHPKAVALLASQQAM